MSLISITNLIFDKIKFNHNADTRQNIFDYKNFHKIGNKGILKHHTKIINFKSLKKFQSLHNDNNDEDNDMNGGSIRKLKLNDGLKYEFYLDEITPENSELNRMCFMSNSLSYDCLCILYGTPKSGDTTMIIESVLSNNECVKCEDKTVKIKPGDILMQILLKLLKLDPNFSHIKNIELSDTSKKSCYDIGIGLKYLRTITNGIPYYAKFGFRPKLNGDYETFQHNRNNYKKNKTISSDDLLSIIEDMKNNMKENTYDVYLKYIKKYIRDNKNIDPKIFFTELIDIIDISLGKKDMTKDNIFFSNKIIKNKKIMESICDLLNLICKDVFIKLDYKDYIGNIWTLKLS
jgi:hypothetical protein